MKKHLLQLVVLAFTILNFQTAKAQYVTIPDSGFLAWLNANGYQQCLVGNQLDTSCPAVMNATTINTNSSDSSHINSLDGIQYFRGLDTLQCWDEYLTLLPTLPPHLKFLSCPGNQITSLGALPNSITCLECGGNFLHSLPALPNSITYLDCSYNPLYSLPSLPTHLKQLDCEGDSLDNFTGLPDSLVYLYCQYNNLSNLPPLPGSLQVLYCYNNQLTSLPTLPAALTNLFCCWNRLAIMPPLPRKMIWLACNENQFTTFPALPDSLTFFDPDHNPLTTLPALPNALQQLTCFNDQLTSLPQLPASLKMLDCDSNLLTSLPELPDTMSQIICTHNPGLHCLPYLTAIGDLEFDLDNIICLPNYGTVARSNAELGQMMLCSWMGAYNPCTAATGVSNINNPVADFRIFPNPATSSTTVSIDESMIGATLNVTDITGRKIITVQLQATNYELETTNLAKGVYLLQVATEEGRIVRELVKE